MELYSFPEIVFPYELKQNPSDFEFTSTRLSDLPKAALYRHRREPDPLTDPSYLDLAIDFIRQQLGFPSVEDPSVDDDDVDSPIFLRKPSSRPVGFLASTGVPQMITVLAKDVRLWLGSATEGLLTFTGGFGLDRKRLVAAFDGGASEAYDELTEELSRHPVKALAWHPFLPALAFVHHSDAVRLMDMSGTRSMHPPGPLEADGLKHPLQQGVTCVAWRPGAAATVAVGGRYGVCVWRVQPLDTKESFGDGDGGSFGGDVFDGSVFSNPAHGVVAAGAPDVPPLFPSWNPQRQRGGAEASGMALDDDEDGERGSMFPRYRGGGGGGAAKPSVPPTWMTFLSHAAATCITSIAWSPDGTLLAAGSMAGATSPTPSASPSSIVVWDIASEASMRIPAATGGGTRRLLWSPNGQYLAQVCVRRTVRVWRVAEWDACLEVEASGGAGAFADAVWVDQGKTLALAVEGTSRVTFLQLVDEEKKGVLTYRMHPQPEKLTRFETLTPSGRTIAVGGPIRSMEMDPTFKRMAVTFDDLGEGGKLVALFALKHNPLPELHPIGFIRGPQWSPDLPTPAPPSSPFASSKLASNAATHPSLNPFSNHSEPSRKGKEPIRGDGSNFGSTVFGSQTPVGARGTASTSTSPSSSPRRLAAKYANAPVPVVVRFARRHVGGALMAVAWGNGEVKFVPCEFGAEKKGGF
ncbi:hypothetical protein HDU96_006648 [Phlyctochytrium bullatum]|nr:hypothetical protein HDU96_006648 [Phlyctochytrium bullatum]